MKLKTIFLMAKELMFRLQSLRHSFILAFQLCGTVLQSRDKFAFCCFEVSEKKEGQV